MEEELNGPLCAGFESVIPSILEEGTCKDLCGDGSLLAGRGPMPCDEPESLAAYPITLPSMPLSFATVQWDVPTPADLPSPMTDSSSVDELSCSDGVSPDWVVNPLSMVPPTPTESVPADDMLPDGNEVTLPQSVAPPSEQHSDSNQQACDPVEEDVTMSPMATGDKEPSLSGDEEISPSEEPSAEDTAPVETECTDTSELPECNSDHAKSPGEEESVPDMEEEEEEEKNQPLPETVTEIETEEQEQEQDCCADAGGDDGGTLEENMCCDSTQDGEGVVTESSVSCGDETTAGEPTALTQESRDGEEIPVSGEDEQRDPDEDPTSADQMTAPEPTEPQESESVDGMEDSPQPNNGSLTEQQEPPETGEENQPERSSSPGETAACEEGTEGSDGEERSEVAQLMHDGETSTLTEEQIAESSGSPTSETEGTETCPSLEGEELEEMGLETAEHNIEQTESLNDQPEVENMEEASAQPEEMEQSLGIAESEPSETEHASENMEETMVDGGLSVEAERLEETGMEVSDMTKSIEESDDTQGGESRSETNQTAESAEMNSTEEQTTPTETKESNDTQLPTKLEKTPTEESAEAAQTDSNPEQSETKQQEGQPIEQIEASPQTERTELTECAKSSAQTQNETEQTASAAEESEGSLQRHMEETTEQLEGQMQGTGDSEEVETAAVPYMNGGGVDRDEARRLAEKLFRLEGIHRTDVVRHLDKDNDFSRVVGEEYLKFFDFTGQTLDQGLRAFLKVVVLIGETQERERVLQRFSSRFHECNPHVMPSSGAVLTLTCAIMLLNTDLHGQNVGKAMSQSNFVSNLDGMNDGENFSKDLLKGLYNSIKNEPLEWAVDEKELQNSMLLPEDAATDASMRSKSNPFQSVPHDKKATVFHKGFLKRKAHADIDGKRTPWGKRSWKTFYAVLKGMVLYLQKDDYSSDWNSSEEVVSVHHALAERAVDYTKRPYVFRLQTADWRVFLFEAASTEQMNSWIVRINLVSALYSSPPFPAAVGSQRKFTRPILPASQSTLALDKQLQSHAAMLQSFQEDLAHLQEGLPEGRKPKARELEEYKVKEDYLQHERSRYEMYVQMLEAWGSLKRTSKSEVTASNLGLFDQEVCKDAHEEEDDEVDGAMKRSHSSPSLELETAPPPVVKVRRNISERRTYRKIIIPRRNREL